MTTKEFMKYKFQAFEVIEYKHPHRENFDECMILQIDFINEIILIEPFEKENYHYEIFWVKAEHCRKPLAKMKILKK